MTTLPNTTQIPPGGRWLYPLLLFVQTIGVGMLYWKGLPFYRHAIADASAYEPRLETQIWALTASTFIQVGYWIRYRVRPALPRLSNVVLGHFVLFWARVSFVFGMAVFSLVFIGMRLGGQMPNSGYIITIVSLFSLFCYMQEVQRLGEAILNHPKSIQVGNDTSKQIT
jgi:uncharacterized membrane protein